MELKSFPYSARYSGSNSSEDLCKSNSSLPRANSMLSEVNESKQKRIQLFCGSVLLFCVSISISLIALSISIYILVYTMDMNCNCSNATVANVERNVTYPDNHTVSIDEIELLKTDIENLKLLFNNTIYTTNHKVDENTNAITYQAQLQDNITTETNYKIDENTKAITRQAQLQDNTTAETNDKIENNTKAIIGQAQSITKINNEVTSILENNITTIFQMLSNITVSPLIVANSSSNINVSKDLAIFEDLPSFQDAFHDNCTFNKLSSCTLPTTAQYGSAIPTFWSCKTNPISASSVNKLGTVQCVVTEYGNEINPIGASLSLTEVNGMIEYRCLCSVIVATTIWRQSSVTCSLVHRFCLARESVNVTLSHA